MPTRRRASVVCVHEDRLLLVRLEDPLTKLSRLFPPGGMIEEGETPEAAAIRETREETGYDVLLEPGSGLQKRYPFVWAGKSYDCLTYFYRARLLTPERQPERVFDAAYHRGVEWISLEQVPQVLAFDASICAAVLALSFSK